jgi:hypothetical protein
MRKLRFVRDPEQFRRPAVGPVGRVGFVVAVGCCGSGPRLDEVVDDETHATQDLDPVAVGKLVAPSSSAMVLSRKWSCCKVVVTRLAASS